MKSEAFCSLLPHGSAVTYMTPGRVWIALNGATPGRIFWISVVVMAVAERVALTPVTTMDVASPSTCAAWSAAGVGVCEKAGALTTRASRPALPSRQARERVCKIFMTQYPQSSAQFRTCSIALNGASCDFRSVSGRFDDIWAADMLHCVLTLMMAVKVRCRSEFRREISGVAVYWSVCAQ